MSRENLSNTDAIKKLKELSEKARTCMFITNLKDTSPQNSRPMGLQECDKDGNLWFISSKESRKNIQIEKDNKVQLYFMNSSDYEYLSITGEAFIYDDRATIEDKWSEIANAWFDGKEDPDVSIIRVSPSEVYYWDTKYGKFVSMVTFLAAIVTGKKTDNSDGVEGKIKIHT
jgi:general stress protein 26